MNRLSRGRVLGYRETVVTGLSVITEIEAEKLDEQRLKHRK